MGVPIHKLFFSSINKPFILLSINPSSTLYFSMVRSSLFILFKPFLVPTHMLLPFPLITFIALLLKSYLVSP